LKGILRVIGGLSPESVLYFKEQLRCAFLFSFLKETSFSEFQIFLGYEIRKIAVFFPVPKMNWTNSWFKMMLRRHRLS